MHNENVDHWLMKFPMLIAPSLSSPTNAAHDSASALKTQRKTYFRGFRSKTKELLTNYRNSHILLGSAKVWFQMVIYSFCNFWNDGLVNNSNFKVFSSKL